MHAARLLGTTLCLAATLAHAAGFRFIQVPADAEGPVLNGAMWYPCSELPGEIDLGGMTFPGTKDCPITGDKLPLVVISHGRGGNFIGHHDTAETLADAGFIVAAINHPGDTHFDQSRSDNLSVWIERPSDIKRLVDFMLDASPAASTSIRNASASLASRGAATPGSSPSAPILIGPPHCLLPGIIVLLV
jgi:predicted dienelactone hydrolase